MYLISSAYFIAFTYLSGATLGKRLFHLKVIDKGGEKLTFLNVIYRETIGRFLSGLLCLGYLLIAVDTEKRGLHDVLCDTRVIYTHIVIVPDTKEERTDTGNRPVQNPTPIAETASVTETVTVAETVSTEETDPLTEVAAENGSNTDNETPAGTDKE